MKKYVKKLNLDYSKFNLTEEDFTNHSDMHGIGHTYRVMYNCLLIGKKLNDIKNTKISFCAAFIHDLARRHDGRCESHGYYAVNEKLDKYVDLFIKFGLDDNDLDGLKLSSIYHSLRTEIDKTHKHYIPISILKDADALDRARLGDLKPEFLRFDESKDLIEISENLYFNNPGNKHGNFLDFLLKNLIN